MTNNPVEYLFFLWSECSNSDVSICEIDNSMLSYVTHNDKLLYCCRAYVSAKFSFKTKAHTCQEYVKNCVCLFTNMLVCTQYQLLCLQELMDVCNTTAVFDVTVFLAFAKGACYATMQC